LPTEAPSSPSLPGGTGAPIKPGSSAEFELPPLPTETPSSPSLTGTAAKAQEGSSGELDLGPQPPVEAPSDTSILEDPFEIQNEPISGPVAPLLAADEPARTRDDAKTKISAKPPHDEESVVAEDADAMFARSGDDSMVDLGAPSDVELVPSEIGAIHSVGPREPQAEFGLEHLADEESGRAVVAPHDEEEAEIDQGPGDTPARRSGGVPGWVMPGAAGAVAGSAVCVVLSLVGFWPGSGKSKDDASTNRNQVQNIGQTQVSPVAPPQEDPLIHAQRGDFDRVLAAVPKDGGQDPEKAERLKVLRGEALWLSYLQKKKSKRLLKADDPQVQEALECLQDSTSPEGIFWRGHIQESTGDIASARKSFQQGLNSSKGKPEDQALFQSALDRLDALSEGVPVAPEKAPEAAPFRSAARLTPNPAWLDRSLLEASVLIGVVEWQQAAGQGEQAPPDLKAPEAGHSFWKAVKLANLHQYQEAATEIEKARVLHDGRRFQRLRKAQNPLSDPVEEIFLRTCDELVLYWNMLEKLEKSGYLNKDKQPNPVKALGDVVAALKTTEGSGATMKAVVDRLKKEKEVTDADPEVKELVKDLERILQAKQKSTDQLNAVLLTLQQADVISDKQPDPVKGLEKLLQDNKAAKTAMDSLRKALEADKYVSEGQPSLAKGLEKLLADQKETAAKLKALLDQPKVAPPVGGSAVLPIVASVTADLANVGAAVSVQLAMSADRAARMAAAEIQKFVAALRTSAVTPKFETVDTSRPADPLAAERLFANGLTHYWARRYSSAENDLFEAVRSAGSSGQDARYLYFLGLARLAQGKRDVALETFKRAGELERQHKPSSPAVSYTLERVQGPSRRLLDSYRP
jgi:tetratricopeptide (TPR) repeat protein